MLHQRLLIVLSTVVAIAVLSPLARCEENPWDPETMTIMYSQGVAIDVSVCADGDLVVAPLLTDPTRFHGHFIFYVETVDGTGSTMIDGTAYADGTFTMNSTAAFAAQRGFWGQFWEDYTFFLAGGSAPADPVWLNYGSEIGFGVAGVAVGGLAGMAAGGAVGVPVYWMTGEVLAAEVAGGIVGGGVGSAVGGTVGSAGGELGGTIGAVGGGILGGVLGGQAAGNAAGGMGNGGSNGGGGGGGGDDFPPGPPTPGPGGVRLPSEAVQEFVDDFTLAA